MKKLLPPLTAAICVALALTGCRTDVPEYRVAVVVTSASDGRPDAAQWARAEARELRRTPDGKTPDETGVVRILRDQRYLYVKLDLNDSDLVAQGKKDQEPLYKMGDTIEIFLKPENETYYWELYGTVNGLRSQFFYPSRSYIMLPDRAEPQIEFEIAVLRDGALNDWRAAPAGGWLIEFRIPLRMLERHGAKFRAGNTWRFLVARQNYSRRLPDRELSSLPPLSVSDFHMIVQYGRLIIE